MSESEKSLLVCVRVADDKPHTISFVDTCGKCGAAVWRAHASPDCDMVVCGQCVRGFDLSQARYGGPTREQIRDMARARELGDE